MFNKILVPFDLSDSARAAFGHAALLARTYHASVDLLHVVEPVAVQPSAFGLPFAESEALEREMVSRAVEALGDVATSLDWSQGLTLTRDVKVGWLPDAIVDYAREVRADLIVAATHGRTGLQRWLLGSVTERLLRVAPCPVLVARGAKSSAMPLISRIMVATDFSEHAERALHQAVSLALKLKAKLELVHVVPNPVYAEGVYVDPALIEKGIAAVKERLVAIAQRLEPETTVEVLTGFAKSALLDRLETNPVDLLVLGTHGRRGVRRALLGSVAENVVRHAPCACLIVP